MMNQFLKLSPAALSLTFALALTVPASAQSLPNGEGKEIYENVCGACHGADIVIGSEGTKDRWEETVEAMKNRGASGSDSDFAAVLKYLAVYFGTPVNVNTVDAKTLSESLNLTAEEGDAIVKARKDSGNFKVYADLAKVQGVDVKKLDMVKTRIKF
ncbi:MAG: helix-hairpin-helix domain-containing protein [Acidobacteriota bacterium]